MLMTEAKLSDTQPSAALKKFQAVLRIPAVQLFENRNGFRIIPHEDHRILVAPAFQWLATLP